MAKKIQRKDWVSAKTEDGRVIVILTQGIFAGGRSLLGYIIELDGISTPTTWTSDGVTDNALNNIATVSTVHTGILNIYKNQDSEYITKLFSTQLEAAANITERTVDTISITWNE